MPFLATGRYRLERGTGQDQFGDDTDTPTQVTTGVLGSVMEQSRTVFDRASDRVVTVRQTIGRFRPHTDVQAGDRVIDQADGTRRWVVTEVHSVSNPAGLADAVCELTSNTTGG